MDRITRNKIEELSIKVTNFLRQEAANVIRDVSGSSALSGQEIEGLVERAIAEMLIVQRLSLHSEVWLEDVEVKARDITSKYLGGKVKNAFGRVSDPSRKIP